MDIGVFIILAILAAFAIFFLRGSRGKVTGSGHFVCTSCGTVGEPATFTRGSMAIEIILWICFIIPGVIYSLWRLTTRAKVCPMCKAAMIPVNTPRGQELTQKK